MSRSHQVLFLSHGGGPLPILGDPGHAALVECLQHLASIMPRPSAILVVSAHWEEQVASITSGASPSLIYDYYGFPEPAYQIEYPCQGEPRLAERIAEVLAARGFESHCRDDRGFDHGLFIPLKILYPEADIPCVQLSLLNNLDPKAHFSIGQALKDLTYDNLLVIGSGFSFHNLKAFFAPATPESSELNASFEAWLKETCSDPEISEEERRRRLCAWEEAPGARFCHPREEHLLPLHVCCGLAGRVCDEVFDIRILNRQSSLFLWQT